MAGRRRSHSEARWPLLPPTIIRCNATRPNGSRCKREAEDGAVVCGQHGAAAPQVRRRAAERLIMTADQAAQMLVKMMEDTEVPFGVRAKIAQDLLDRAGLIATQVHQIIPMTEDPVMRFFEDAFSDPSNWEENPPPDPRPAIESYANSSLDDQRDAEPEETLEAEIAEPEGEPANDTPPRVAEMIKAGAFDRKPGQ
jgi:hypothetical protein